MDLFFLDEKRYLSTLPRLPLAAGLEAAGRMCLNGLGAGERVLGRRREELKPPMTYWFLVRSKGSGIKMGNIFPFPLLRASKKMGV